jgi:hypothetical protein
MSKSDKNRKLQIDLTKYSIEAQNYSTGIFAFFAACIALFGIGFPLANKVEWSFIFPCMLTLIVLTIIGALGCYAQYTRKLRELHHLDLKYSRVRSVTEKATDWEIFEGDLTNCIKGVRNYMVALIGCFFIIISGVFIFPFFYADSLEYLAVVMAMCICFFLAIVCTVLFIFKVRQIEKL